LPGVIRSSQIVLSIARLFIDSFHDEIHRSLDRFLVTHASRAQVLIRGKRRLEPRVTRGSMHGAKGSMVGGRQHCHWRGLSENNPVFENLHSRDHDADAFLYAFDLLELEGEDWRPRPLEERTDRLAKLIADAPAGLQYSEHMEGDGAAIFAHACKLGFEGIVSKRCDHIYRSGSTKVWFKIKNPNAPGVLRFEERE
jgi:hypothetical protein